MAELARQLTLNAKLDSGAVLAIVPLVTLNNKESEYGKLVAEELTTLVFRFRRFKLVERRQLQKAIDEMRLQDPNAGITDPKTAQRLGRMVNAKAILVGTHQNLGSSTRINARIIGVSSGEILSVGGVEIENTRFVDTGASESSTEENISAVVPINETIYIGGDWLTIIFDRVELVSRNFLKFTFTAKNPTDDIVTFSLDNPREKTYVVDEYGNSTDFVSSEGVTEREHKKIKAGERFQFSLLFKSDKLKGQKLTINTEWQAYGKNVYGTKRIIQRGIPRPR
jgi:TolB-like protein